jgi:hypothetical protein
MAYCDQKVIALLGADVKQSGGCRQCVQREESDIQGETNTMQMYELQALEKNRRNKLLLQRNVQHQEKISTQERRFRQLNQQLEEQEQVTAEIQQTNHSLQRQVEQLQQWQAQKDPQPLQLQPPVRSEVKNLTHVHYHTPIATHQRWSYDKLHPWKMTMTWRDGGWAPIRVCRGASAVKGNVAYLMNWGGEMCFYNSTSKQWGKLPKCPYQYSSLAVINGCLTAIGGCTKFCDMETYTNKLLSLQNHEAWVEIFPAMPTKRRDTSSCAITSKEHLMVAGGMSGPFINSSIATVEVMNVKTLVWSTVASLPHPYTGASATICGDQLFLLGGSSDKGEMTSVLTCSLTELLQSSSSIWHRVADAPAYSSTCATVNGELLAVGGCDKDDKPSSAIHKYNPTTNSWDLISNMPTARYNCLTATMILPTGTEMNIVGGESHWNCTLAKIETATSVA